MLDGTGDSDRDVEVGAHQAARLSDLFGGGISSSMGGSSIAERNLDRLTIIIGVVWFASIIALNLLYKLGS